MKTISDLHLRVVDKGLFLPIARRLAREARKVSYWTPGDTAFDSVRNVLGLGFPEIERVECYLEDLDTVDGFVFPDIGLADVQVDLSARGIPVWGHFGGDELETDRGKFLDTLEQTGLEVPVYEKIKGLSALREHLKDKSDRWIKISRFRGDLETFHWRSLPEDGNLLDYYAVRLGPLREQIAFYVFEPIEAEVEDGCDSWNVDGEFPSLVLHGMEAKDKAFIGTWQPYDDLPEELRRAQEAFAPILGHYGYRAFFSTEVRVTPEGKAFFIDPTCRAGSPPSQIMTEMIGNYAEVIWGGANGELVDPEPAARFGVQALVHVKRDEQCWTYVKVNDELDRWLKSTHALYQDGYLCLPPGEYVTGCEDWLVGIGDTLGEAIRHLKHNVKLLPCGVECEFGALAELLMEVDAAEEAGMEFTPQAVPPPEIVVQD